MVFADNALKLSSYTLEAQQEVWGKDPVAQLSNAVAPVGRGKPVDGGVLWTGRHGFSSGVDHAGWVMASGYIERGEQRQACSVLIPRSDITIVDDWHVLGLAGSGSKTFVVDAAFVPEHRILDKAAADEGRAPGNLHYTVPVARLPRGGVSAVSFTAVVVGIAEGFLQEYYEFTGPRLSRGTVVAEQMGTQIGAGVSAAEVEAAVRMYLGSIRETMRTLERGETVSRHDQVRGKRNAAYAAQLALSAVQRLFNSAGGRALYLNNELQRKFRDVHAAAAHHSLVWDSAAASYGRYVLGLHGGGKGGA
jgi:3-hydroxy-9,10-secoandrosta-1,3,5(10)-triene-9,17-dione monooxygenase